MSDQLPEIGDEINIGNFTNAKGIAVGRGASVNIHEGLTVEEVATLVVKLKNEDQPTVWNGRFPYLGLTAFQESDAQFFFGRESLVDELLERVKVARFIVIAGPSGSGKSSVARAGLFHALREGKLEKSDSWLLATMQPKGDPIEQLALAMTRLAKSPSAGDHLRQQGRKNALALHEQIEALLGDDGRQRSVLLVDQFEETFTQTKSEAERAAFIGLLTEAARVKNGRLTIILSLRADFVSHCARYPDLRALMSKQFQLVGAMDPSDLAKAITLPSLEVGAEIDPALVSRIMADMKGEPGALPLMSFALRDLFEAEKSAEGKPMDLTLPEYLERGGIESALERHANTVFATFSDEQKGLARGVFSKLIEVGQGRADTRRTAVFSELIPSGAEPEAVAAVVDALAQEGVRLITTSGSGGAVTIAHEKLIDAWPWLRQLVDENREMIVLQNQINDDAKSWREKEDSGYLYRGGRLIQVEEQLNASNPDLNELSQAFIQASLDQRQLEIEEKEAQQRREVEQAQALAEEQRQRAEAETKRSTLFRRALFGGGILVLFLLIVVIFAGIQTIMANEREQQALAQSLVANARALMADRNITNQELVQARLLAAEGAQLNRDVGRPQDQTLSEGLLYALATEKPATHQPVTTLTDHTDYVRSVAWNGDGSRLASASDDNSVIIWQADENQPTASWQPVTTLTDHTDDVLSMAWNGDGARLASASADGSVIIWQADENQPTASWQPVTTLTDHTDYVRSVAWNGDGSRLASASCSQFDDNDYCIQGEVIIWDTASWQPVTTLTDHTDSVVSMAWNGDGSRLASASGHPENSVTIWDTASWQPVTTLTDHRSVVRSVAWNEDGSRLASASSDSSVIIWDTVSWQPVTTLTDHTSRVNSVAWNRDGSRLVSASSDSSVIIWDSATWQPVTTFIDHTDSVESVAWNGDGSRLVSASSDTSVIIWDTASWQPVTTLTDHTDIVESVAWNGDGSRLVSASWDNSVIIWDSASWQPVTTLTDHTDIVESVAWNGDGSRLASASWDSSVIIWDTASWQPVTTLTDHTSRVWSVAWNGDGSRLASASWDNSVIIWDTVSWQPVTTLTDHTDWVNSVAWNGDGSRLASASYDSSVIIWDTASWQPVTTLTDHTDSVNSVAWNGAGSRLASTSSDNSIIIWDSASWQPVTTLADHTSVVSSVAWNGDGSRLASASWDNSVIIWDSASWQPVTTLTDHTSIVESVAWNRDGSRLASASWDNGVIIWEWPDFAVLQCELARRNLSLVEWEQYLPGQAYRRTCAQWPAGEGAPADAPVSQP